MGTSDSIKSACYHQELLAKVAEMRAEKTIYPPQDEVFNALKLTPFDQVRAVILG